MKNSIAGWNEFLSFREIHTNQLEIALFNLESGGFVITHIGGFRKGSVLKLRVTKGKGKDDRASFSTEKVSIHISNPLSGFLPAYEKFLMTYKINFVIIQSLNQFIILSP
ncbi:MAG: hypothetical protein KAJ53_03825 [Anaerolineales bacterium]|nr:hypothetical protein [Anaerolineales bacterium]